MTDDPKYSLTNACAVIGRILACITFLSIAACTTTGSSLQTVLSPAPPTNAETPDLSLFDSIVTPETVFPDPAVRALYKADPPNKTAEDQTIYTFELIQQPGMVPHRDDHIITVTLVSLLPKYTTFPVRKREYHDNESAAERREESFEFAMPTPGNRYAIFVESRIRLPNGIKVPEFDPESTAKRLQLHYLRKLNKRGSQLPKLQPEASSALPTNTIAAKDLSLFDNIVTPEAMFPDPATRALYKASSIQTQTGERSYSFALTRQPGMDDRYFHRISVIWAPAGTFNQGTQVLSGAEGDTIDFATRTSDGKYDLRVSEVMRLSDGAKEQEFDPISTAERLLSHYLQEIGKRLAFFDNIVTPKIVFPDPAARALYEASPPVTTKDGGRTYVFAVNRQPGMGDRDFHVILVAWAPAGTFRQGIDSFGGPGGSFINFTTRTTDGFYDLFVSEAMRLPVALAIPDFDLESTTERLLKYYSQYLDKQSNH